MNTVLLIRFGKIGDMLLLYPPLKTLRRARADLRLVLLVDTKFQKVASLFDCIDEVRDVSTEFYSGSKSPPHLQYKQKYKMDCDVIIDFQAEKESVELVRHLKANAKIGFNTAGTQNNSYTDSFSPENILCWARCNYELLKKAFPGIPESFNRIPEKKKSTGGLRIGLFPGGSAACKRWSLSKWKLLSENLKELFPHAYCTAVTESRHTDCSTWSIDSWVHDQDIRKVASIINTMDICVSNESGLMHLSAITGCRTVGLFGFGNTKVWAAYSDLIYPVFHNNTCSKDSRINCEQLCYEPDCLEKVQVDEVLEAIQVVLNKP
jgi:ADP-heptose:LPS heptosyltransferase